jgi:S-adenosylmethionine:tRNA ribosyltransferase-isomerase
LRVDAFDYELPPERIALRPASPRDAARLLVIDGDLLQDKIVADLPALLRRGDLLVLNDTAVIPAQLKATRTARLKGGEPAQISFTLHKCESGARWRAFARPAKRLQVGDWVQFGDNLRAIVEEEPVEGELLLSFDRSGESLDKALQDQGEIPLPPYIATRRPADAQDRADYQTIYARAPGAVAAPTAGLHFTPKLLSSLAARGIGHVMLTLHVGPGTFLPVKANDTKDHVMHAEWGRVTPEAARTINVTRKDGGRLVAVGTTSLRLLESAADEEGRVHTFEGETRLFITPGYRFRTAELLLTNFHLPRSTLLMLVQAFGGVESMRRAYAHAIAAGYRFYSYGDACLIHREAAGYG